MTKIEERLSLLENAFFGDDEPDELYDYADECGCDLCYEELLAASGREIAGQLAVGVKRALEALTITATEGTGAEALRASELLLGYGLSLAKE